MKFTLDSTKFLWIRFLSLSVKVWKWPLVTVRSPNGLGKTPLGTSQVWSGRSIGKVNGPYIRSKGRNSVVKWLLALKWLLKISVVNENFISDIYRQSAGRRWASKGNKFKRYQWVQIRSIEIQIQKWSIWLQRYTGKKPAVMRGLVCKRLWGIAYAA